ncbi:class I SAM-dependent methyltransferase, partial [Herbaspirillum sp. HC18]
NITAHYDLGNDFYRHWLDGSMTYSSALYEAPTDTLETAQQRKLDRIVEMLALSGGEHVLEIGCGWGALAERLAREGCRVTAITLSPSQLDYAQRRIAAAGLADRVDLRLQDYRDVVGTFDRIVSIEMIEAVGRDYWPTYFAALSGSLTPH